MQNDISHTLKRKKNLHKRNFNPLVWFIPPSFCFKRLKLPSKFTVNISVGEKSSEHANENSENFLVCKNAYYIAHTPRLQHSNEKSHNYGPFGLQYCINGVAYLPRIISRTKVLNVSKVVTNPNVVQFNISK